MDKRLKINLSVLSAPVALFALYTGAFTDCLVSEKGSHLDYSRAMVYCCPGCTLHLSRLW